MSLQDHPLLSASTPRFPPRGHNRSPSRSPTRTRITDDIFADLSPSTTLEAFTSASGTLKASIEAASPTERAFGIRAAVACKKIQEWVDELTAWQWPAGNSAGFEVPAAKRRRSSSNSGVSGQRFGRAGSQTPNERHAEREAEEEEVWGSLLARDVIQYETRIEEITEDMEDLDVEEIKRTVLGTHILPLSRPSSAVDSSPIASSTPATLSYTRMGDFTAVITATVLRALPTLSRLNRAMDVWSIRLMVLRKVPPLMTAMDDVEIALRSGWSSIEGLGSQEDNQPLLQVQPENNRRSELHPEPRLRRMPSKSQLTRNTYDVMQNVLQEKVRTAGQQMDHILDILEGRADTIPDAWLDRMEAIEQDYGEWAVLAQQLVLESGWEMEKAARQAAKGEDTRREAVQQEARQQEILTRSEEFEMAAGTELPAEDHLEHELLLPATSPDVDVVEREDKADNILDASGTRPDGQAALTAPNTTEEITTGSEPEATESLESSKLQGLFSAALSVVVHPVAHFTSIETEEADVRKSKLDAAAVGSVAASSSSAQDQHVENDSEGSIVAPSKPAELHSETDVPSIVRATPDVDAKLEDICSNDSVPGPPVQQQQMVPEITVRDMSSIRDDDDALSVQSLLPTGSLTSDTSETADNVNRTGLSASKVSSNGLYEPSKENPSSSERTADDTAQSVGGSARPAEVPLFAEETLMKSDAGAGEIGLNALPGVSAATSPQSATTSRVVDQPQAQISVPVDQIVAEQESRISASDSSLNGIQSNVTIPEVEAQTKRHPAQADFSSTAPMSRLSTSEDASREGPISHDESPRYVSTAAPLAFEKEDSFDAASSDESRHHRPSTPSLPLAPQYNSYEEDNEQSSSPTLSDHPSSAEHSHKRLSSDLPCGNTKDSSKSRSANTPTKVPISQYGQPVANKLRRYGSPQTSPVFSSPASASTQIHHNVHRFDSQPRSSTSLRSRYKELDYIRGGPSGVSESSPGGSIQEIRALARSEAFPRSDKSSIDGRRSLTSETYDGARDHTARLHAGDSPRRRRSMSLASNVSGYRSDDPSPEIHTAEPAEYFHPILSPIQSPTRIGTSWIERDDIVTPTEILPSIEANDFSDDLPEDNGFVTPPELSPLSTIFSEPTDFVFEKDIDIILPGLPSPPRNDTSAGMAPSDGFDESDDLDLSDAYGYRESDRESDDDDYGLDSTRRASVTSLGRVISGDIRRVDVSRGTPFGASTSLRSPQSSVSSLGRDSAPVYETSGSSSGGTSAALNPPYELSKEDEIPNSPPSTPTLPYRRAIHPASPVMEDAPSTPVPREPPLLRNINISAAPQITSPTHTTDDQFRQQISEILHSIPAQIHLRAESDTSQTPTLSPLKKRTSLIPSLRPSPSRAPTPSFTLSPAHGKNVRPTRTQGGNPEIKLYHLSRSTGEAPIKLFVRLVGEHGERVMVRVGGGWADLGEYLMEYASHHGRRPTPNDKVEIQDLPPRRASGSVTPSFGAIRIERSSPNARTPSSTERPPSSLDRPASSLGRPMSALSLRKSRKSFGDLGRGMRESSMPLPVPGLRSASARQQTTTPTPDGRSESRMSWTEEEGGSLGLAGPKGRRGEISEENRRWVESMKEKVKVASAEKERRENVGGTAFGGLGKVGGTKRLFWKA